MPKFLEGIPVIEHRKAEGEIQFATVSKNKAGQYYVSITAEREIQSLPDRAEVVAHDLNVHGMVDSNGNVEVNPRPAKQYAARLKLLHQTVSRSKKGSNGRTKAKRKLAKLYLKVHNKREDHLHKLSKRIVDENQVICLEDLSVSDMLAKTKPDDREEPRWKERQRHKDIADCGFYSLVQKLMYKAIWYGREVVKVSRWYPSSQLCNKCGWRNKDLKPTEREWCCWNCWENNQRNHNSACNSAPSGWSCNKTAPAARTRTDFPKSKRGNMRGTRRRRRSLSAFGRTVGGIRSVRTVAAPVSIRWASGDNIPIRTSEIHRR